MFRTINTGLQSAAAFLMGGGIGLFGVHYFAAAAPALLVAAFFVTYGAVGIALERWSRRLGSRSGTTRPDPQLGYTAAVLAAINLVLGLILGLRLVSKVPEPLADADLVGRMTTVAAGVGLIATPALILLSLRRPHPRLGPRSFAVFYLCTGWMLVSLLSYHVDRDFPTDVSVWQFVVNPSVTQVVNLYLLSFILVPDHLPRRRAAMMALTLLSALLAALSLSFLVVRLFPDLPVPNLGTLAALVLPLILWVRRYADSLEVITPRPLLPEREPPRL